jgi:hypothetical protein
MLVVSIDEVRQEMLPKCLPLTNRENAFRHSQRHE